MKNISTNSYKITIPENWKSESNEEESIYSFYNEDGFGALSISSYLSESSEQNCVDALKLFIGGHSYIEKRVGDFGIAESQYEETEEGVTRVLYVCTMCKNENLLLISYNVKKEIFSQVELDQVKSIIDSIHIN